MLDISALQANFAVTEVVPLNPFAEHENQFADQSNVARASYEVFGDYIHTYKFGEAVEDKVVLDLIYEARDIEQALGSEEQIDAWFEAKTQGLNDWQKDGLSPSSKAVAISTPPAP